MSIRAHQVSSYHKLIAILFSALLLAACKVDATVTLDVTQNGSGTLAANFVIDNEVVSMAPELETDLKFDDLIASGWEVVGPNETADNGLQVSLTNHFSNAQQATTLLSQLGGSFGPFNQLSLTRSGSDADSTYTFDGIIKVDDSVQEFADQDLLETVGAPPLAKSLEQANLTLAEVMNLDFVVSLPGVIMQTTGVHTGNSITWEVPLDGSETVVTTTSQHTVIKAAVANWVSKFFMVLLGLWIAAMAVFTIVVLAKRLKSARTPSN